jgi:hypothetical protein
MLLVDMMPLVVTLSTAHSSANLLLMALQEHRESDEEGVGAEQPADQRRVR